MSGKHAGNISREPFRPAYDRKSVAQNCSLQVDGVIQCRRQTLVIEKAALEPISHFFYSDRLKLQFWDYGVDNKPALVLVHGGLDHARNWDWVARSLREHYHVSALYLPGPGK